MVAAGEPGAERAAKDGTMSGPHSDVYFMAIQEEQRRFPAQFERAQRVAEARGTRRTDGPSGERLLKAVGFALVRAGEQLVGIGRRLGGEAAVSNRNQATVG
jgi:hypothetical protein